MNSIELFDDDILDLLNLIVQRNKLAKIRSCKRSRLGRLKKSKLKLARSKMSTADINKAIILAEKEYLNSCNDLAVFTENNKEFRQKMSKKYSTRQKKSPCNEVDYIRLKPIGYDECVIFYKKDFETIVLENELNEILLRDS